MLRRTIKKRIFNYKGTATKPSERKQVDLRTLQNSPALGASPAEIKEKKTFKLL